MQELLCVLSEVQVSDTCKPVSAHAPGLESLYLHCPAFCWVTFTAIMEQAGAAAFRPLHCRLLHYNAACVHKAMQCSPDCRKVAWQGQMPVCKIQNRHCAQLLTTAHNVIWRKPQRLLTLS